MPPADAPALEALWAKGAPRHPGDPYHPLVCHLIDVAVVAEAMWTRSVPPANRRKIASGLGLNEDSTVRWLSFWAGLHDLGKASPAFHQRERFTHPIPHGTVTTAMAVLLLTAPPYSLDPAVARTVATAIGGHHGRFPAAYDVQTAPTEQIGDKRSWRERRAELVARVAHAASLESAARPTAIDTPRALWLAGLVSVADWIGSNDRFFPFGAPNGNASSVIDLERYRERATKRAVEALNVLGWTARPFVVAPRRWDQLFPAIPEPNDLQRRILRLAEQLNGPSLILIEAPMGEGKTEAALALADDGGVRHGLAGHYLALPTQATSNQMFGRDVAFLNARFSEEAVNVQLLHGQASLSTELKQLRRRAAFLDAEAFEADEDRSDPAGVIAAEWFARRKRGLLAPFGVGTIDQVLLAVLQTKRLFVRLFGLAGKTVVLDEIHAYDAYTSTLLERLLAWLAALGCRVVLLSATLPASRRARLLAAFAQGEGTPYESSPASDYPRLSWLADGRVHSERIETSERSRKAVRIERVVTDPDDGFPALADRLEIALAGGGCAAVVCNTVGHAQRLYRVLKQRFPGGAADGGPLVDLLHARFPYVDREEREQRTLRRFGPSGSRPHRAVLVATQVIEQSLDIDVDLLVSEYAPIDLLLQRIGRLHRHDRPDRPPGVRDPVLSLLDPPVIDSVPAFRTAITYVYDEHILLRSWLALDGRDRIAVPGDVEALIEAVYDDQPEPPDGYAETLHARWRATREKLVRAIEDERAQAGGRLIKPPAYRGPLAPLTADNLAEDAPELHRAFQALTRLGGPSLDVVCLERSAAGDVVFPDGSPLRLRWRPDDATAERLLRRSTRVGSRFLVPKLIAELPQPSGWRAHPLLSHHRLAAFDARGRLEVGGTRLWLSPELGLVINGEEAEEDAS